MKQGIKQVIYPEIMEREPAGGHTCNTSTTAQHYSLEWMCHKISCRRWRTHVENQTLKIQWSEQPYIHGYVLFAYKSHAAICSMPGFHMGRNTSFISLQAKEFKDTTFCYSVITGHLFPKLPLYWGLPDTLGCLDSITGSPFADLYYSYLKRSEKEKRWHSN